MIDTVYFTAFILIFLRILCFFILVQAFYPKGTPPMLKVGLTIIITFLIITGVNYSNLVTYDNTFIFIKMCICEVITGVVLGYFTNLCFMAARFGGQLLDFQMGLSMINMFDPSLNSNSTLLENLLYWFSLITFFNIDGVDLIIRELIESFNVVKLGKFILSQNSAMSAIKAFTDFFALGFKIALPIILIIMITDLTMGLISRTVPQLNVMILELPLKILIGFAGLSLALPYILKYVIWGFEQIPSMLKDFYKAVPIMFIFASEEKTEEATPKKKEDARKKAQVPKSKDVTIAVTLIGCTLILSALGMNMFNSLKDTMYGFLANYMNINLNQNDMRSLALIVIIRAAVVILPVAFTIIVFGVASNFIQTGFLLSGEPLKPDFSKLNPINGFKRMFSLRSVVQLIKDTLVVTIIGYIGYRFLIDNYKNILNLAYLSFDAIPRTFLNLIIVIFLKITVVLVIIALADFVYQWYQYNKDLKMTKQEVKEEYKQMEGDPQIKSKRRQMQRELASRRMMSEVPKATVVVTNPTHIAVALKYEDGKNNAPILVAKGSGYVAIKIKEIAKRENVPIFENKPLARLIYSKVEIDSEIPEDMYQAVAEILALVFKLKKKK